MARQYLVKDTYADALASSKTAWLTIKTPGASDVTTMLFPIEESDDGKALLVVISDEAALTSGEQAALTTQYPDGWKPRGTQDAR